MSTLFATTRTRSLLIVVLVLALTSTLFARATATGEELRGDLFGWGPGIAMSSSLGGTFVATSGQITDASTSKNFKFFKDSGQWYGNGSSVTFGQIASGFSSSGNNSSFNHIQNSYYAAKWNGNDKGVIFQLGGAPESISGVSRDPASPSSADAVTVTLTTASAPPAEQTFFLRYTTNNFSTSTVVQMTGSGTSRSATIPAQSASTNVIYYVFSSANTTSIAPADADLMAINADTNGGSNYNYTVTAPPGPITATGAKALWLDQNTIAWNGVAGTSYKLVYDPDGGVLDSAETAAFIDANTPGFLPLTVSGTIGTNAYPKNPNANGLTQLLLSSVTSDTVKALLKGQVIVAAYDGGGARVDASRVQVQGVLDDLYVTQGTAAGADLGVTYSGGAPTVRLWAPTAKSVSVQRFADSSTAVSTTHSMTLDPLSGVWSVTGDAGWDRDFYLFDVQVYVPSLDAVVNNLVTDPYALTLSTDTSNTADPRSQFVNLADADLKPAGWDSLTKPALAAPEDIVVYEMHVRDFSINDSTVNGADRGTFMAFTYDGAGPDPNTATSDGMEHLLALKDAGLTHVHLLPAFDIASVPENSVPRTVSPAPTGYARNGEEQQAAVGAARATDGFNWGYDPYHYGAPEGSYSTDPDGVARILEFRRMVSALNQNDLRVVMDVVYNHTAAKGQEDKSVLDKVVPGYYYRYDASGTLYESSCCADTAAEYAMFEKLMIDTLKRWAVDYKVDGFRFDLMNLHTRQNMLNVKSALAVIDPEIYLYGEGWDFGSALSKGLTTCPDCYAKQTNMTGQGIGLFNDKIRDAAHGGYSTDDLGIRKQGFINGLSYDWNGFFYSNRDQTDLRTVMDILRSGLRASGTDWNSQGSPFTDDPQEAVNYVEKHDNETLFDQNVFKLPLGENGTSVTSMADRVRAQNMGTSIVGLAQGIPFIHMGQDILRSKSLDRNSYDSGDWFNRVDWTLGGNNFGQGLPPTWDNNSRWDIMGPLLANTALDPATADMEFAAAHLREILRIRQSSPLFRLRTEAEINAQTSFYNTGATPLDGLVVMSLADTGVTDLDASNETILIFFNANKVTQTLTIANANGFSLHPIQADNTDADPVVKLASFDDGADTFSIPARTTAVFVSDEIILPVSTLDFVGRMYPRGSVAKQIDQGAFAPAGFDIYVQVYEPGVTDSAGQGADIACYLHWGEYGAAWSDVAMTYNTDVGNNDEYKATIPQATINALTPGAYGFTAYCQRPGEDKKWKQDLYDIDSNAADDDQGDGIITIVPTADSSAEPAGGVFVHLFEWRWTDIQKECPYLAAKGYTGVQVSPPMEHVLPVADMGDPAADFPWWVRYQPVTHDVTKLTSRSGSLAEFQAMVDACNTAGVSVIIDAVINHTTGVGSGTGAAGSTYTTYDYPQYDPADFHACGTTGNDIASYSDRAQVQTCELANLADLDTGNPAVQGILRTYMQDLLDMGVKGFRIDAAKHMAAQDLAAILDGLTLSGGGSPYIFQEVIDQGGEPVRSFEYTPNGDVTEFNYSVRVGEIFNGCSGSLSALQGFESSWLPSRFAQIFTDNHDNQRGHGAGGACILDHRDGFDLYNLGSVFMLAYPYGHPSVMSSYYWSNNPASNDGDSKGPPSTTSPFTSGSGAETSTVYSATQTTGDVPANCSDAYVDGKWVCEHRRTAIANMVGFRQATGGEPVTDWVNVSSNHIAFGRGSKGYVAINREASANTRTYTTTLPAGYYCNITAYDFNPATGLCVLPGANTPAPANALIKVEADGQILNQTVDSMKAFAIHVDAKLGNQTINVGKTGNGDGQVQSEPAGITCGVSCAATYIYSTTVTLTAAPNGLSNFDGWSGACTGMGTCTVVTTQTNHVTATFSLKTYPVITATDGTGSGSVSLDPAGGTYSHGTVVTATASANTGSTFTGWSGACSGTDECVLTMTETRSVTATFTLNSYALVTATDGTGSGTVDLDPTGGTYDHGTVVTATANAGTGSAFAGWSGACTGVGECTITMTETKRVTATFGLNQYTIAVVADPATGGSVAGGDLVSHGATAQVTATSNAGYGFVNWSDSGGVVSTDAEYSFTAAANRTLTATFAVEPITGLSAQNSSPTPLGSATFFTASIGGGTGVGYAWSFGNGASAVGATAMYTYPAPGAYTAWVTATNGITSASANTVVQVVALDAYAAQPGIAIDGAVVISALLKPPAAGETISFTLVSGSGALSDASAVTDGSGVAVVTYTAPNTTTVARIEAVVANLPAVTDTIYVHVAAPVSAGQTQVSDSGIFTVGNIVDNHIEIVKVGEGTPTMGWSEYTANPCPEAPGGKTVSPFVDVHVEDAAGVDAIVVTIRYTDTTNAAQHKLLWCDNGVWMQVDGVVYNNLPPTNTMVFTITNDSLPTLLQLEGTPLVGVGSNTPTAVIVSQFSAQAQPDRVRLAWDTVSEVGVYGFHLYRSSDSVGPGDRITAEPVWAQGAETPFGFNYLFDDWLPRTTGGAIFYWLDELRSDGSAVRHGPAVIYGADSTRVFLPGVFR
jgi:pullulanase